MHDTCVRSPRSRDSSASCRVKEIGGGGDAHRFARKRYPPCRRSVQGPATGWLAPGSCAMQLSPHSQPVRISINEHEPQHHSRARLGGWRGKPEVCDPQRGRDTTRNEGQSFHPTDCRNFLWIIVIIVRRWTETAHHYRRYHLGSALSAQHSAPATAVAGVQPGPLENPFRRPFGFSSSTSALPQPQQKKHTTRFEFARKRVRDDRSA
ncbi:hypothetical protein K461DRAFT_106776 [Myriangium duriaei CBS 260.36]|uniref:Uncharacterized protein n=1 Tax=Myriangium duriaei CBS 260.36 TaxID=1168546 RepID=A0A9P4J418_9PEZI|nr:hypothetical protein K461DRAFT_106776 [Myriangium duriaei CBS 260.36]